MQRTTNKEVKKFLVQRMKNEIKKGLILRLEILKQDILL